MVANVFVPNLSVGSMGRDAAGSRRVRRGLVVVGLVVLLAIIQNPVSEWLASMRLTPQPESFTELSFVEPDRIVDLMQRVAAPRGAAFVVVNHEKVATSYRWHVDATEPAGAKRRLVSGVAKVGVGERIVVRPEIPWTTLDPGTRVQIGLAQRKESISFTLASGAR